MRALGIKGALLDVRPEDEFAKGHIPGTVQTDLSRLAAMASTLDPAAEIVACCRLLSPIVAYCRLLSWALLLTGSLYGWNWMDPMIGIVGGRVIARWSRGLIRDTGQVLLD